MLMRKIFLLTLMLFGLMMVHEAKANSTYYYAKVTVDVAEDSKGLGTVYILNEHDEQVMEVSGTAEDYGGMNTGANYGVMIINTPADGYVLVNFTDQYGQVYTYPDETSGSNPNIISVFATSTDEADPSVFNLSAHFVLESELPKGELAEVTVSPELKYATYMSPVAAEIPDDIKAYRIVGTEKEAVVLETIHSDYLDAFTPVLLENTGIFDATISATFDRADLPEELPSLTSGLLTGAIDEEEVPLGSYVLMPIALGEPSKFIRVEDEMTTLEPFTCFMTVADSDVDVYDIENAVAVCEILQQAAEVEIYDLEGRKLSGLQKGVNIVGGTKIIVR